MINFILFWILYWLLNAVKWIEGAFKSQLLLVQTILSPSRHGLLGVAWITFSRKSSCDFCSFHLLVPVSIKPANRVGSSHFAGPPNTRIDSHLSSWILIPLSIFNSPSSFRSNWISRHYNTLPTLGRFWAFPSLVLYSHALTYNVISKSFFFFIGTHLYEELCPP